MTSSPIYSAVCSLTKGAALGAELAREQTELVAASGGDSEADWGAYVACGEVATALCSSRLSVTLCQWMQLDIPEDMNLHQYHCENFRFCSFQLFFIQQQQRLFVCSFIHFFIHSFIHSFIPVFTRVVS